jgi:hypothetical protein
MTGAEMIAAERERQVTKLGWDAKHDDTHENGELADAAACYAATEPIYAYEDFDRSFAFTDMWPWGDIEDKRPRDGNNEVVKSNRTLPTSQRLHELVVAGALIAAEIDRLARLSSRG